jgi:hypothetical protein
MTGSGVIRHSCFVTADYANANPPYASGGPNPLPATDARLRQHELRAFGVGFDLLAQLADIDPQILRVG